MNTRATSELILRTGFVPGQRPYLAFFRSGPGSLHERLLAQDPARNWDCCVNWWSRPQRFAEPDMQFFGGFNKLEGFADFMDAASFAASYRYVMLLDDDIDFSPGDVSRMFEICDRHGLYLAQPALRHGSYVNHVVTARNPLTRIRRSSFVEVMAPCFSAEALRELGRSTFRLTRSVMGIDLAWSSLLRDRDRIRIVDEIAVAHTRPVDPSGGAFYRMLKANGIDAHAESADMQSRYPSFGSTRTLRGGHVYRAAMPEWIGAPLVALADAAIRARYGSIDLLRRWRRTTQNRYSSVTP